MRYAIGLVMAGCLLIVGCKKGGSSDSAASDAPSCATADTLLLNIDNINENVGMQSAFQAALQSLPDPARESAVNRINAKVTASGANMRAPAGGARQWIALLLLSTKSEARAVKDFRYCNGDFDFGNGQRWHWVYSMSNGANGPELRINSAEVMAGGAVTAALAAQPPVADTATEETPPPETSEPVPAQQAQETAEDASDAAAPAAAPPTTYDVQSVARERELARIAEERRQIERDRRELARQREQAAAQREAEAVEAREAQARAWREQQEAARRGPTADELYEQRRGECPRGFLGSDCRHKIKQQICTGHWSANPEPGYSNCRAN
jgi:chemotaxis protein histidine kinase CheA